jgi:copper(I)-binding protein
MKNIIQLIASCMLAAGLLSACGPSVESPELTFESAWIRAMPPGMKMTAGFGILKNHGSKSIELNSFTSPSFGDVSLHRTELVDGMSKMREVKRLEIPAGGEVELAPGGYHLMLMMPTGPVETGAGVTVQLTAVDGRSFNFDLAVERR